MTNLPPPLVTALLLLILLARLIRQRDPVLRPSLLFIGACAGLTMIVALRWSFDIRAARLLQPVVAAALPPLAWYCFIGPGAGARRRLRLHALPPVAVALLLAAAPAAWRGLVDVILVATFLGYGVALLRIGAQGPDALTTVRLSEAGMARGAMGLAGLLLTGSGLLDLAIALDFDAGTGAHAARIVGLAHLAMLPPLAWAIVRIGQGQPPEPPDLPEPPAAPESEEAPAPDLPAADDIHILGTIDAVMRRTRLYRDPDLTLNRLARGTGIPARRISAAINRLRGRNVSQFVNDYRIGEAARLLTESDLPITTILFEAGFQTKSNFNREFRRVTGMSPSDYRRAPPFTGAPPPTESPPPERP